MATREPSLCGVVGASKTTRRSLGKGASSRYDYVKVRVWLASKYYYVLSRFSVSQILMLCRVPQKEAQKIALRLKKHLVDQGILDIEQENLNQSLFQLAQSFGISETCFSLYSKVLQFYQLKLPSVIVLYGVHQVSMTEIAGRIAERLNIYNVLDTDTVYHTWRLVTSTTTDTTVNNSSYYATSSWLVPWEDSSWLEALEGNLFRFIREGKAVIIYGLFLQPMAIASMLEKYGSRPYFLQYLIESELFQVSSRFQEDSKLEESRQLYTQLYDIQQEYKQQAQQRANIPSFLVDSTKESIGQLVERVHEDYLRFIVSLSEQTILQNH